MSLASDFSALLMKRCSSSVGAYDLCRSSFSNVYSPCRVRTLERTVYSQLINADFPCSFGHEDTIRMSLDLPCNLCPVIAVHMFTGKTSIWYVYLFLMVDPLQNRKPLVFLGVPPWCSLVSLPGVPVV